MATDLEAARLLTYWAASETDQGKRGYSTEYEIERLYRDSPLMSIGEGTNDIMRMVIAKQIFAD